MPVGSATLAVVCRQPNRELRSRIRMGVPLVNLDGVSDADLDLLDNDRLGRLLRAALNQDDGAVPDRPAWDSFISPGR